jgi:hypothetical protein
MKKLPKKFQGAAVVRGLGMKSADLDKFTEREALDQFDATRDMWIVVENGALEDLDNSTQIKGFLTEKDAIRYARAMSNGNVDHRVLRVTAQTLVVATDNAL